MTVVDRIGLAGEYWLDPRVQLLGPPSKINIIRLNKDPFLQTHKSVSNTQKASKPPAKPSANVTSSSKAIKKTD